MCHTLLFFSWVSGPGYVFELFFRSEDAELKVFEGYKKYPTMSDDSDGINSCKPLLVSI